MLLSVRWFLLLISIFIISACKKPASTPLGQTETLAIVGSDMSFYPEVASSGMKLYNSEGAAEDMLMSLKRAGFNTVRLRIWHQPNMPTSSFETVRLLAEKCKSMGLKVWITIHYSDTWADPGNQQKPKAWASLDQPQLEDSVYAYTYLVVKSMKPEYVQIGNEINNGMLWPNGSLSNMWQLRKLVEKGILASREANASTKIMLHCAGYKDAPWFFNQIGDMDYDIAAISYYPVWHGKSLDSLGLALVGLNQQIKKPTMIAETSYPFTLSWNDWTNNVVGLNSQLISNYPATPQGQKDYWEGVLSIARNSQQCLGVCYWGGEWISYKGNTSNEGSTWENQAFWDFEEKALPILEPK